MGGQAKKGPTLAGTAALSVRCRTRSEAKNKADSSWGASRSGVGGDANHGMNELLVVDLAVAVDIEDADDLVHLGLRKLLA